jgi:hypothetical protein
LNEWLVKPHARIFVLGLIGWWCLGLGCVPPKVRTQSAPQFDPSRISSVAVLPFQAIQTPQRESGSLRGRVGDIEEIRPQFHLPGARDQVGLRETSSREAYVVSKKEAQRLTAKVVSALVDRPSLRVIGPGEALAGIGTDVLKSDSSMQAVGREAGTRLHVDGVLTGLVRTYRDREGSKLGAIPAAVGFEIYLLRSSDGALLWSGEFFEEQKPLTQDVVGFFEKGGGFVTADELADLGVQKVMEAFPVGRNVQK